MTSSPNTVGNHRRALTVRTMTASRIAKCIAVAAVVVASAAAGILSSAHDEASAAPLTARGMLRELRVEPEHRQGYAREKFVHWIDADSDGLSTREEVLFDENLNRRAAAIPGCRSSGRWYSWYENTTLSCAQYLDVDHKVALQEAWDSGADTWTPAKRTAFANDIDVTYTLDAVSRSINESKAAHDPATWVPPYKPAVCRYVTDWVKIKYRWNLAVDVIELSALERYFAGACGDTPVGVTKKWSPASTHSSGGSPSSTTIAAPVVFYANCAQVRAASKAPLAATDPGYRLALDGDRDGIACEGAG